MSKKEEYTMFDEDLEELDENEYYSEDVEYLYHRIDEVDQYNETWSENIPF